MHDGLSERGATHRLINNLHFFLLKRILLYSALLRTNTREYYPNFILFYPNSLAPSGEEGGLPYGTDGAARWKF